MNRKGENWGGYTLQDCDFVWMRGQCALEHTVQVTEAEMEWICREWAGHVADELQDGYGRWRTCVVLYAEERLRCFADTLGLELVYETLVEEIRRLAGAEGLHLFYEFWNGFPSLDPWRSNGDTPPS